MSRRARAAADHRREPVADKCDPQAGREVGAEPKRGRAGERVIGVGNNYEMLWVGWPGVFVEEGPNAALTQLLLRRGCLPIYLSRSEVELYYNGYCNNILWPLFHYVPLSFESKLSETKNMGLQWEAYQEANELFARVILNAYQPGDAVWCHDYHLMLLPSRLKDEYPSMKVGWFLHTPFPSSEIYRMLPVREELLLSVLAADLIGFHTYDYARHFVSACSRILGFEGTPEGVEDNGDFTRVAAFPIGIDPGRFTQALETERVQAHIHELRQRFQGRKVMLGVDRLDMIKGIPQKLLGFEKFLSEHPEWRDRVLLVQIAVPTRTDVPEYQRLTSQVHEIVGRINGRFGTLGSVPIQHLDCSLAFTELCALYAVTDVCLVTSLRDGMNLVSYEFVACQSKNAGVLVLSEFAGAAQSLGAGALLVNPWNVNDMAAALEDALTMPEAERRERQRQNFTHITMHTAQAWADTFVSELSDTHVEAELRRKRIPPAVPVARRRAVHAGEAPADHPRVQRDADAAHGPHQEAVAERRVAHEAHQDDVEDASRVAGVPAEAVRRPDDDAVHLQRIRAQPPEPGVRAPAQAVDRRGERVLHPPAAGGEAQRAEHGRPGQVDHHGGDLQLRLDRERAAGV